MKDVLSYSSDLELLYVEDNEDARIFTMEFLSRFFKKITVAEDGEEGLKLFKEKKFDLIISDINMPKMDGMVMSTNIRNIDKEVPIILLSAHDDSDLIDFTKKSGMMTYLQKPLMLRRFIEVLRSFINTNDIMPKKVVIE